MKLLYLKNFSLVLQVKIMTSLTTSHSNQTPPSGKKDYQGPLYAPWWKVEEGKKQFREWVEKNESGI